MKPTTLITTALIWGLLLSFIALHAQNHNRTWLVGYHHQLEFGKDSVSIINRNYYRCHRNALLNDKQGNILLYVAPEDTFGIRTLIYDKTGTPIKGQEEMVISQFNSNSQYFFSLSKNSYILIYQKESLRDYDLNPDIIRYASRMRYYSALIEQLPDSSFRVVEKDHPLAPDKFFNSAVWPVRHANGLDWWLIFREYVSSTFHVYRMDMDGNITPHNSLTHTVLQGKDLFTISQSNLSGNQLFHLRSFGGVDVLNFDRCSGFLTKEYTTLIQPLNKRHKLSTRYEMYSRTISTNLNSNFFYISMVDSLYQFEYEKLEKGIDTGFHTVMGAITYKGNGFPFGLVYEHALGPDGKIYVVRNHIDSAGGYLPDKNLHLGIIEKPDQKGEKCRYIENGLYLGGGVVHGGFSSIANSDLGPLTIKEVAQAHCFYDTVRVCRGDSVHLGTFARPNIRYRWSTNLGIKSDTIAAPWFIPLNDRRINSKGGVFWFILTATALSGYCLAGQTANDTVIVIVPPDSICGVVISSRPSIQAEKEITFYPNPTSDHLTVHFGMATPAHIQVIDMKGVVVYQAESQTATTEINLSDWNEGVYLLRVNYNRETHTEKLVIVR